MENLPAKSAVRGSRVTVADFLEAGGERMQLKIAAGRASIDRVISEPIVNRLGLALTGFYKCFAWGRVQVVGNAESAYLDSMPPGGREARFKELVERKARVFVLTDGHRPSDAAMAMAEKCGAVILTTPLSTRLFSRHATFVLEQLAAPRTSIYGTMVEVYGLGILIEGDPGLGKSETALGLIKRGHAIVADDLTCIRKDVATDLLFASASESTAGFMEIRGIGIVHIPRIFGVNAVRGEKRLQLVITFRRLDEIRGEVDRIGQTRRTRTILGVDVPNVVIPVSEGRDLVNLVEAAAQQQKLISAGFNPAAELSERLRRRAGATKADNRKGRRQWQTK